MKKQIINRTQKARLDKGRARNHLFGSVPHHDKTYGQALFHEEFRGPYTWASLEEPNFRGQVWTHTPPTGWTQDDSKMPGVGDPGLDGITEWVGWSFANKNWWWRFVDNRIALNSTMPAGRY
jgi:hypothetical protein